MAPKFRYPPIQPFTQVDVQQKLKACTYSRETDLVNRRRFVMRRPTTKCDKAIIFTQADTGLRLLELCSLKNEDFDPKHGKLEIQHGVEGGPKRGKGPC